MDYRLNVIYPGNKKSKQHKNRAVNDLKLGRLNKDF